MRFNGPQNMAVSDPVYVAKNWYSYTTSIAASLANAASTSSSFQTDGDSDFFVTKLTAYAQIASDGVTWATQNLPGVTVVITNTSNGRQYMNNPVPLANLAGNASLPFIIPIETFWAAKTTISIDYANITDNSTYTQLYLTFHGIKAFRGGA